MTNIKLHKKIYDIETGIETIIDLTPEEIEIIEAQQIAFLADLEKSKAEQDAKDAAKAELLAKLGITEDEAKLLLS